MKKFVIHEKSRVEMSKQDHKIYTILREFEPTFVARQNYGPDNFCTLAYPKSDQCIWEDMDACFDKTYFS